ncbi:DUF3231 family protein [Caldalkalibacillus salinus]|uniref:DUF3231 family protein n=1 Tax=Caldalkalibacillus salinus TaxID=2803787 RepID=UPI0019228248|nr:DUF3231 family protein [Caldalkalibacillus salinus]
MNTHHHTRLTAPEIASLWTQYLFDTMSICFTKYALSHIEDEDIRHIYQYSLKIAQSHVEDIRGFFEHELYPIPQGFTKQDVDVHAPRLFQDTFYLNYLYIMSLHGLSGYSLSLSTSIRKDLRDYYVTCNEEAMEIFQKCVDAVLKKGIYNRPPVINPPEENRISQASGIFEWVVWTAASFDCYRNQSYYVQYE